MLEAKLPQTVKINNVEVASSELKDSCKKILADLIRIDEEIAVSEFELRKHKAAKNELQRLLSTEFQS